jgi:HAD superfamily hydrolase (TIGR01509 family)
MKKTYNYILFDWDGTLAKTLDIWLETYKFICNKYGVDISNLSDLEIVERSFGLWAKGLSNLGIKNFDKAYEESKEIVDEKVKNVEIYINAEKLLKDLTNRGKKLALHTSSFRNMLYPTISNRNLEKYFSIILTKDDVKNGKPDPEVINKELAFFKIKPEKALIVGDSDSDIKAGNNAGVDTVLFYPEEHKKFYREEFLLKEKPTYVINDLLELLKVVN